MTTRKRTRGNWMRLASPEVLKAMMDRRGFSYERLARYAGCSKSFIGHLRSGHKTTCTEKLAVDIAEALDVPLDVLFVKSPSTDRGDSIRKKQRAAA